MQLNKIGKEMVKQSNRGTQSVMFIIQEEQTRPGNEDYDEIDHFAYRFCEEHSTEDWGEGEVIEGKEDDPSIDKQVLHDCFLCDNIPMVKEYVDRVRTVGTFFTEKAAQDHLDENHYHYGKTRIYGISSWRNPEMQSVQKHLIDLAEEKVPNYY